MVEDQQGGAPVVAHREPGWYDDPWNDANIRRWDGEDWTGETAPKPSAPAPESPAAAKAVRASARRKWPVNPLVVGGVVAAVVVVGVVVAMSGHSGPTSSTGTTVTPASTPSTAAAGGLPTGVLNAVDVGGGWTPVESRALAKAEYTQGPCSSALWARNTGGYMSSFVKGATVSTAHGSVITRVVEAPDVAVADQQQVVVRAPAYGACLQQTVESEVRSQLPAGSGQSVTGATAAPFSLQLPVPTWAFVISVTVSTPGGGSRVVTDNTVTMVSGRYLATIDVS